AGVGVLVETHVIEDEELGLRSEIGGVSHAGVLQIELSLFGNPAGIALVVLPGERIAYVANHDERRGFHERVYESGCGVGDQQHVALVDGGPSADAGSVDAKAFSEGGLADFAHRVRDVVLEAGDVGEADVDLTSSVFFRVLHYLCWCHVLTAHNGGPLAQTAAQLILDKAEHASLLVVKPVRSFLLLTVCGRQLKVKSAGPGPARLRDDRTSLQSTVFVDGAIRHVIISMVWENWTGKSH